MSGARQKTGSPLPFLDPPLFDAPSPLPQVSFSVVFSRRLAGAGAGAGAGTGAGAGIRHSIAEYSVLALMLALRALLHDGLWPYRWAGPVRRGSVRAATDDTGAGVHDGRVRKRPAKQTKNGRFQTGEEAKNSQSVARLVAGRKTKGSAWKGGGSRRFFLLLRPAQYSSCPLAGGPRRNEWAPAGRRSRRRIAIFRRATRASAARAPARLAAATRPTLPRIRSPVFAPPATEPAFERGARSGVAANHLRCMNGLAVGQIDPILPLPDPPVRCGVFICPLCVRSTSHVLPEGG